MPDFDKDLNVKIEDVKSTPFDLTATAPKPATPYTQSLDRLDYSGATDVFARLKEASQQSDPSGKGVFITNAELDANKRYETFNPTIPNYEDFAAYGQSVSDKAANGILKGLNLAATTVAGGFGMLYGAIRSPFSGRLADIWDNEVMRGLDDWNTKVDQEYLPNYYTDAEKNSAWYSTNNWFKANFLFDKLIKNSGFAVGAMVSGNIANAGLLRAGAALGKAAMAGATAAEASQAFKLFTPLLRNTARAFSAAKNVEAAAILEKEISSIADLTTKTSKLGELSKVTNAFGDFGNGARRTAIAAYSSAGEASFEAMQTSNEYRENLIQKYKDENYGQEPTEEILKDINVKSEKLGKASFFGNLAILGVTEYVQLPYILGSSYSATKKASNSLLGKIERTEIINGVETAIKPKTRFGKLYEKASGVGKYVFDPKEAAQEGLQYALQVGTQNYYNKAFEGNDADFLVDGVLYGLFGKDELGQGKGALVSKEGLEGMLLGGITGNLMQARGKYKESKQIAENTQRYLNEIKDAPTFRDAFKDRLRSINRNTVLQQEQQDVIVQGDKLEAKDLDADIAHNYLSTRIKYGRYEMVKDDINDLRAQSIDETGLSALKQQGMANVNDTLESFREKLNNFENVAKYTNEIYRSLDLRYSGEANEDGSRKYSPVVIDKMAYMSAKIANYDIRIPQLNAGLASNGIATFDVLENILEKNKPAKKVIADATAKIEELNIHPDLKTDLITNLKHIVELSLRRKLFLNEFENIKLNPEKYETLESTIEEFLSKSSLAAEFKNKEGVTEPVEVDREYQISKSKKALVDKIEDDKWQVTSPDGSVTFYPSKEKADEFAKTINAEFDGLDKIKILGINSEGKIKIEDSNGDVYYIDPAMLNGYEKVKSSQEKLLKDKNDIDAQQAEIENKSGDTSTGVPEEDEKKIVYEDGFRKILSRIFSSTTAQSEADPTKLIPSSKRANIFRNNLKNFKNKSNIRLILVTQKQEVALGLEGLANLSMGSVGIHTNVDTGFVAAVYVEQDGATLYFVNEKGERTGKVGEKIALDKMIFDTMPSTSLSTSTGLRFDEKTTKKEDVQELANQWKVKREQLLNITGFPEMYSFDLSRGIPKISNKAARHAVGKTLVSEDLISTQQGLIVIPTTKTITHQGETINFPNGRPVLQYEDTLQPLNNRKFNKKEAEAIFLVIQYLCDSIKKQSEQGQKVKIDRNFATFLQSVLYYRKSADTAKNQFYIDTATMDFFFGGKMYDVTKIAESKDAIIQQLLDVYNNVNNYTLTKDFDATFREYYINDKGQLVINNWENYQTYLMSSTYPNGTARPEQEIPLTTNVDKITDLAPTNYKAKYSILQGLELPQVVIAPVAPVAPAPAPVIITPAPIVTPVVEPVVEKVLSDDEKVQSFITAKISGSLPGSYNLEGDIFEFKAGNISFTAKLNDKGKYDVTFDANDVDNRKTIDNIKATPASMVAINNFIEAGKPKAPEAPAPVVETKTETPASKSGAIKESGSRVKYNGPKDEELLPGAVGVTTRSLADGFVFVKFDDGFELEVNINELALINEAPVVSDLQKQREEELKPYDERDERSLEAVMPNNPNHPGVKVGMKFNEGLNILVERTDADSWDGKGEGYTVITAVISPAEFGEDGKMTKAAKVNLGIFNSKEEADKAVQEKYEKVKSQVGKKQKEINAKYDALEAPAVSDVEKLVLTEENYNRWSNVRDKSDYDAFVYQVRSTLAMFDQVQDKSRITTDPVEKTLSTVKAFANKAIRDQVVPLIVAKYKTTPVTDSTDAKADIEYNRLRNKEQKNAGAPVLDGQSNAWFAYYTPEGPSNVVSFKTQKEALNWIDSKYKAELAKLEENKPTAKFNQSFGDFTVYEGSDGSYDVQDDVEEGVIAEYIKTKEEAILIAKQADVKRKREKELEKLPNNGIVAQGDVVTTSAAADKVINDAESELSKLKEDKSIADKNNEIEAKRAAIIDDWAAESMADQQYWAELALSAAEDGGNIDSPESYEEALEWEKNGTPREQSARKINEKYEKLLAELDATKPAASTPTTTGKKGLKNKIADKDIEFRKVGRNEETAEKMSDLDIQLFKEWHAKNASTIPYEVLDGVIRINSTEKAWGAFEAGVAKFYKGAIRGTEYHEIFEGIWKAFLTPEQRQNILDEFKSQKGTFLDRESGKRISYDEATDLQAKERIADDFAEFRLGKLPGRTIKEKILKFFRDIINFFKSFVQNPSLKRDLFNSINKGKYNKRVISESVKNEPIEYSKIGNLTETQSYNFVQDITARVFQIIFSTNQSLYNLEKLNSGEVFNQIKNVYLKYKVIDDLDPDQLTSSEFDELVGRTKDFLRVFKIDFDHDSDVTFNNDSRDRNEYASSPFVTDWKKLSPFAIKIVLASLTETVSTNQENKSLSLPKLKKDPETDTFKLLNFSRAFATCLSQFANTTDVSDLIDKLGELAKFDSNYVRLYTRLGGVANTEKAHINFAKFKMDDWRLFVNFYQTFSKQKPDALIQYINGGSVHTATANLFEAKKDIKSNWIENLKGMVGKPDSLITYNYETNAYKIKTRKKDKNNENESNGVLDFPIRSTQDKIAFLAKLGIEFPIEAYGKLKTRGKTNQVEEFGKAVSAIREYFGSNQDVLSFTGKTLGVNAQYDKLAELFVKVTNPNQELSFFGIDQKKIQAYAENNAISILENEFNSCKTLDELLALRPELRDLFSKHSVVLKKGGLFFNNAGKRIREFKVAYIQGTSDQDLGKDVVTTSLTLGNRYVQQLNQNLMGNYYILVPADSSTEWMMNLGNIIKFADVESQKGKFAREQMHEIFMGYLEDDIALALADRKELTNVAPRAKELRFFNDILSKELLKDVNQLIADDANTDQVETFLKDKDNIDKINASIDLYIKGYNDATIQTLKDTKRVVNGLKKNYKFTDLDADFSLAEKLDKEDLSEKELNDIVMFANVNYIINNIELHKLLFGDPYQFAIKDGQLDETKRTKAFLSGRRKMFNTLEFNTFLNQTMNQAGTIEDIENNEGIKLRGPDVNDEDDFGDPGYHLNKSYANTVTFEDVEIIGSIATLDDIPSEIQKAYAKKAKETDGISFLMDGAYKEIKLKNGQWPREAEEWHQWQMAYTRQNFPGYVYKDAALEAHDKALVSKPEPKFMIDVLKPIVSGTEHNSTSIKLVLDKFSQMPLYFSMVKGTNLEKMYVNMFKQQIDYAVVLSGRKVGAGVAHPIYNKDGSFNETKYNNRVKVSWASYGIQVENAYQEGKQQPRGSQITKLVSIDIFDNGVATSERAQKEYDRNKKLLGLLHKNGYESFLKKLGIVDLGDGRFQLINNVAVSETLIHEMLRRALSTNAKSTVTLDKDNQFPMPFEASTSYLQIREILFSMIDKAVLSPKMNGSPHVQVPITGWENMGDRELLQKIDGKWTKINKKKYLKLSDEEKSKVVITDTTLKFYTREKPYCEILLPHWFKEKLGKNSKFKDEKVLLAYLNTEEGKKILSGIGFRIPTQSLSSMEVFRVKGFLPASMGSTVVVPSEIVTKAGSDFDIDKLNMYLKSIYIDVNGNIRLVEYKDSEEATREFYSNLFDQKLSKKIVTKKELIEAAIIYASQGEDPKNLVEKYGYILDTLTEEYDSKDAYIEALEDQLDELGDTNFQEQLKEKFVDEMYKRSLENEYYDSLEKIITLPENFDRLISPVDDAGLEDVSKELDDLAGIDEANIPNRILNRNYMTALRHAFVIAKRWVGIAAVNITGQSLTQKSQVYIDPSRFGKLSKSDKKILGDGSIALDHNTTMADGVSRISMSGVKTADGKHYISSRLSGYITSFVDVAKNPYILKIIKSNLIVGTFMFLERIGVGENAAFFLNQPIISDYLKYLDSIDSKTLFSPKNIKFIKASYGNDSSGGFDISLLKENIKNGGTNRAEQVAIFDEFLKYAKMAEFSFKLTQASNYDTAKIRSSGALLKKRILTDKARKSNIFSSVDNILNNSFIAEQSSFASKGFEALGEILKFDQPKFRDIINKVLTPFASREFMSDDDYARIENKIVASFVDYVIQIKSNIGSEIKELLISPDTTVASQLVKAKQDYPDMKILNDLQVASSPRLDNGAKSIKLRVNIKEAYDEDLYIGMMRELRDTEGLNDLYRNILKVAILQGTYQSAISLKNIIPIEDYSAEVAPIISKLTDDLDVQAFTKGWFQRNNFKGEDVFKTATPKFFHTSSSYETGPVPIFVDNFGNETYLYYSYSFPFLESMQVGGLDRKILVLNETFNYLDVQSDHVKVMRVVIDRKTGEKIDMETGETVLPSAYSEAKKKGDLSLRNIYGYEKVKHDDGTPLTFITDYKGDDMVNHVYKLINLYGENPFVTEHHSTFEPSEIDNGTVKIKNEIPNADIINYFVNKYPSQALQSEFTEEEVPEAVIDEPRNGEPRIGEITKNKDGSYNVMLFEGTSSDWKDNVLEVKILPNGKFQLVAFGMRELLKKDLEERFGKSIISKISSLVTQSVNESSESTMAITNFYELLTQEKKDKLGPIEDVIADYESIPFDSSYEDYIESLKCKL